MRPMTSMSKTILGLVGAVVIAHSAAAFTLEGPFESWQTPDLDYATRLIQGGAELGGPKNLGDEWRLNTPIITYGFDYTFLDYFGSNGVKAVDAAFAVFNRLPPVSRTSADLSEYLTEGNQRINQSAEALNLLDVKSATMFLIIEHMGLMSETHTFDLRQRIAQPNAPACFFDYVVITRNFDPITYEPTHYVNGVLYTYQIQDLCPVRTVGDAVEIPVDPTAITPTSVASGIQGSRFGGFYLGLTRDDVGGLRYLYRRNNFNNEVLPVDATVTTQVSPWTPVGIGFTNAFATNTLALRGGIEKVNYVKVGYNSIFGSSFRPITYTYTIPMVTNFHLVNQTIRRTVRQPDILFTAADISAPPAYTSVGRSISFVTNGPTSVITTAGPGIIAPQTVITFNKIGPFLFSSNPFFLDEETSTLGYVWGSFDGTTNAPIVYPQGSSVRELESLVLNPALVDTNVPATYNPVF